MEQKQKKQQIRVYVFLAGLVILFFIPQTLLNGGPGICIHKMVTGIECPLCGMTRSMNALLHFRFLNSLQLNFAAVFLMFYILADLMGFLLQKEMKYVKKSALMLLVISLIFLYGWRIAAYFISAPGV